MSLILSLEERNKLIMYRVWKQHNEMVKTLNDKTPQIIREHYINLEKAWRQKLKNIGVIEVKDFNHYDYLLQNSLFSKL
jgi:hypothetical protein